MTISPYITRLRAKVGHDLLHVPAVAVLVFDERDRVLLVRHVEGNIWTTPGGMIEPGETPADAAVREMWEETGLQVRLTRVIGVFGGEHCRTTYANGDQVAWISIAFEARPIGGTPTPDHQETLETRFFAPHELDGVKCRPHLRQVLHAARTAGASGYFAPPTPSPRPDDQLAPPTHDDGPPACGPDAPGHVRPATDADLPAIDELQRAWAKEQTIHGFAADPPEMLRRALGEWLWVATLQDAVVGYLLASPAMSEGTAVVPRDQRYVEIESLYVTPPHRSHGIGSQLIAAVLEAVRQRGITHVLAFTASRDVHDVLRFYERHGFASWGVQLFRQIGPADAAESAG